MHVVGLLLNYRDAVRSVRCIRSLLEQGVSEILVWDNSADDGASAASIDKEFAVDGRIKIVVSDFNLGFAAGVNRGLEQCAHCYAGAWVLLINNDACLLQGALAGLADALVSNETAKIASSDINHAGDVRGLIYYHRLTGLMFKRPHFGCFPYASGCCLLIATDRISWPLLDEDFFMYGEDCELSWRLGRQPASMVHVDRVLVDHESAASSGLNSAFYEMHMVAAHLILARKLARGAVDVCTLTVLRIPMLVLRASVRSLRFRSMTPYKALWNGAKIARRRVVQHISSVI